MKRISVAEMRRLDQAAIRDYGIPGLLLMENAGRSVAEIISRDYPCLSFHSIKGDKDCPIPPLWRRDDRNGDYKPCRILIFVGKGNNGGDGLVVARHLMNRGYAVQVILLGDPALLKPDPLLNFKIISRMKIPVILAAEAISEEELLRHCLNVEIVVDAILGIGVESRQVGGIFEAAIRAINQSKKPVVSVDIPSGLNADNGKVQGVAVRATTTVTLGLPKAGLFEGEGAQYAGGVEVVDIGIPREVLLPFLGYPCLGFDFLKG